jgi:hypothetical protein
VKAFGVKSTGLGSLLILGSVKPPLSLALPGAKLESFTVFLLRKWFLFGNALTVIARFVYPRLHD